ncbi:MAG: TerC family protein [Syntrophaceae bacterium]|nr:TerC family protein [Syntrophaceae bacterium]
METSMLFWLIFSAVFAFAFVMDLFVTGRIKHKLETKKALRWTATWISLACSFGVLIYFYFPDGEVKAMEFITSYIIEYSLSVDNLFVFIMIFGVMGIKEQHQPRILKWGIIGAIVMRILFITAGVGLIQKFQFMTYVFGAILIYTAYKMLTSHDKKIEPEKNIFVRLISKVIKIKPDEEGDHFLVRHNNTTYGTVALVTLLLIESTDVIFAVDSIPAVLAITRDPFIAITSNLFAIVGLRSLYFALAGILGLFQFLKYGITVVLFFVGVKMLIAGYYHIPVQISLAVIIFCLTVSILASLFVTWRSRTKPATSLRDKVTLDNLNPKPLELLKKKEA